MTSFMDKQKAEQHDAEIELLAGLVNAKLEALHLELDIMRRNMRLTDDESTRIVMAGFYAYATQIAVEEGSTREEHLTMIGEMFDESLAEIAEEEEDDEVTDKESTNGGGSAEAAS